MKTYTWDVPLTNGARLVVQGAEMDCDAALEFLETAGMLPADWANNATLSVKDC